MRTTRWFSVGFLLVAAMFLLPTMTTAQGNSGSIDACKMGGYLDLTDANGNAFKNVGECVSYAAQGGTLPDLSVDGGLDTEYGGVISGTGFTPGSTIVVLTRHYTPSGQSEDAFLPLAIDSNGAFSKSGYCALPDETAVEITATDAAGVSRTESFNIVGYTDQYCPVTPNEEDNEGDLDIVVETSP